MTLSVRIDLARVRENAEAILRLTGVPIIAVVKADAYGLGAGRVAEAIGDLVEAFYVFDVTEAVAGRFWETTRRRTIALNSYWTNPQDYLDAHIHPVVWSADRATALRGASAVLSLDSGQQRFACPQLTAGDVQRAGDIHEIMTHAITLRQVNLLRDCVSSWELPCKFLHAAGSALLGEPQARLDAVRPGLALYRGAVRVSAELVEVRDSTGPAGYTGFNVSRFGVILAGYCNGLRPGPCIVNGQTRRVIEVGMQSAFVELSPTDRRGDSVILLGEEPVIDESALAAQWKVSPQEVLVRMTKLGLRAY